jgi:Ca-activated chloride channel family protein
VAGFSQLLKDSKYKGELDYETVIALAQKTKGDDVYGYRAEFINLIKLAKALQK